MKTVTLTISLFLLLIAGQTQNYRNVLIEYSTATNCGYCPCMDSIVEKIILAEHPNTAAVAYHNNNASDPFGNFYGVGIISALDIIGNPTAFVDRVAGAGIGFETVKAKTDSLYLASPLSPLVMELKNRKWDPKTRMFDSEVNLTPLQDIQGNIATNLIIIENNLFFNQNGHPESGCYGGDNYKHDLVARIFSGGPGGEQIYASDSVWKAGTPYKLLPFWCLDLGMVPENCEAIVMVFDRREPLAKSVILQSIKFPLTHGTGFEENNGQNPEGIIRVYPNPSSGKVNVHFRVTGESQTWITISGTNGEEITAIPPSMVKPGIYNLEVGRDDLADGFYMLTLHLGNKTYTSKLVIRH